MKIGVFSKSFKAFERRIPIHPDDFFNIPQEQRKFYLFEKGYGSEYGVTDEFLEFNFGGVYSRADLFKEADVWVLIKPHEEDFKFFSEGKVLWGWLHCVQGYEITKALIEKKMTAVAWENMYDKMGRHVFQKNNELAGFASVNHSLLCAGFIGGLYGGCPRSVAVLSYGATGRGAVNALKALGFRDISIFTRHERELYVESEVSYKKGSIIYKNGIVELEMDGHIGPASCMLGDYNVIVNCMKQDPNNPLILVGDGELKYLKNVDLIVDVSCDEGMGFYFSKATDISSPTFLIEEGNILYYGVDHSPTIYHESATKLISKQFVKYSSYFISDLWRRSKILEYAIDIDGGEVKNKAISDFQWPAVR